MPFSALSRLGFSSVGTSVGKKQIEYVKSHWQDRYTRKPWGKPLLIAFGCLLGFVALTTIVAMAAAAIFGIQ